ncbi:sulfurtransferase [Halobacteriales archaeon QS_1_68_20]|nr:MAG: sulfurtransferase [Halobacteriales archaeon QS_1_68_20]
MSLHSQRRHIAESDWVADRLDEFERDDPGLRLLEVDMEPDQYDDGHIPGASKVDWEADLAGELGGDLIDRDEFEALMGELGITEDSTVVVYGDKANWFAAHAYWVMAYYGHDDVRLMDGGRHYWLGSEYPTTTEEPTFTECQYEAGEPDESIRTYREEVMEAVEDEAATIDVRNPQEYRGEKPPADIPETTDREGHIPGAENSPWMEAVNADGTFKSERELREVYAPIIENGHDEAVTYCRIGERSSLTWFVLNELLDVDAANYDGSCSEWGNREDTPMERGMPEEDASAGGGD